MSTFPSVRSFVRVRPFTPQESVHCPEGSPVPRGTLVRSDDGLVTVLDPQLRFKPRRNGTFAVGQENLLWCYAEPDVAPDGPVYDLGDAYELTVKPVIPSIVEGYSAAFLVMGAPESGKFFTLYGGLNNGTLDTSDSLVTVSSGAVPSSPCESQNAQHAPTSASSSKGVFYRFCTDIFDEYQKVFLENSSSLSVEVEVVEIQNEQYVDLLNPSQRSTGTLTSHRSSSFARQAPSSSSGVFGATPINRNEEEPIKVILDPIEGTKLSGVTRASVSNGEQLEQIVRLATKSLRKRKTSHTIHLRLTESFEFSDPDRPGHTVSKARRVNVLFSVLHAPPPSFHRCVDVAVERDSGEKANAMVPYRDSAFTKLHADVFMHGYHVTFINCVSPFCDHMKDAMNTLPFAMKVRKIRCNPKLSHDESLVELRKLAVEVKGLKSQVVQQNESLTVVQAELDRREREILHKEGIYNEQKAAFEECKRRRESLETASAVQRLRSRRQVAVKRDHIECLEHALLRQNATLRSLIEERLKADAEGKEKRRKAAELETLRHEHEEISAPLKERIRFRRTQEQEASSIEAFIASEPEERKREVSDAFKKKHQLVARIPELEQEKKTARAALGEAKIRLDDVKPGYEEVGVTEKRINDANALRTQIRELEGQIADLDEQCRQLQHQIDNAPSIKCCTAM